MEWYPTLDICCLFLEVRAMDSTIFVEPTPEEAARILQTIQQQLAEIEQIRAQMQRDQAQIEASGARTDARLAQMQVQLDQFQQAR
jgi:archaellum component FlaC